MAIIKLVFAFLTSIGIFFAPYLQFAKNGIDSYYDAWSADMEYTEDYAVKLEKDPDKDFVVLNFSDVQLSSDEVYGEEGAMAEATIKKAIEETQPDLITMTGDNSWCQMGYIRLVEYVDSFGIPWAAVMGNHDGDNGKKTQENWDAYLMYDADNCLFKFGPEGMGVGNYIIDITENGKVIHSIYMMDSHSSGTDEVSDGTNGTGYDHFWANQIEWYKWAVNGENALAGQTVESTVMMHIPVIQYRTTWQKVYDYTASKAAGVEFDEKFYTEEKDNYYVSGSNSEWVCSPDADNGFFDVAKELGSTKTMLAGHDHVNDSVLKLDGITLAYSLKCGSGCYWEEGKNGGTVIAIGSDGHANLTQHYINPADLVY